MKVFSGISAAPGIAMGRVLLYTDDLEIPHHAISEDKSLDELSRFSAAIEEAAAELRTLENAVEDKEQKAIFAAHALMVEDPDFHYKVKTKLESKLENIEWVVYETAQELSLKLLESSSDYLRERAADLADVSRRIIKALLGLTRFSLAALQEDVILAARNLLPSEALAMNKERVKAVVMDAGSRTSHTAILLRAFSIPAVLGLSVAVRELSESKEPPCEHYAIVDGDTGQIILDPDAVTLSRYEERLKSQKRSAKILLALKDLGALTTDDREIKLNANIGTLEEAVELEKFGAQGIGLFRSEFLFLQSGRNSEEAQFEAYSRVIKAMNGKPVTIRTVDLGGDKVLPGMHQASAMPASIEENPLLGWRAIRLSLAMPDLFKTQLRAILRASVHGKVRIMFPMISGVEELEQALALLEEARNECRKKNQAFSDEIETGTMIEIPSAAITASCLAEKSDFFSIGTNDLIQYTLAVDRGNEKVSYLAQSTHPAILCLVKQTIDAAHAKGISAAMCGEMAGDPGETALLLGLGLDEFSMTASSIPLIKHIIRSVSFRSCKNLAAAALACTSYKQVQCLLRDWHREFVPTINFDTAPYASSQVLGK